MGPLNNPGLIPRSFDVIFNSIGPHLGKKYVRIKEFSSFFLYQIFVQLLRSDRQYGYEIQSEADILLERQRKEIQFTKNNNQRAKFVGFYPKWDVRASFGRENTEFFRSKNRNKVELFFCLEFRMDVHWI